MKEAELASAKGSDVVEGSYQKHDILQSEINIEEDSISKYASKKER